MRGTVVRLKEDKGFGFVKSNTTGVEYFFHATAVENGGYPSLKQGDPVEFEASTDDKKGPRCQRVQAVPRGR